MAIDAVAASPTRVPRWMYVRALIALTSAAARANRASSVNVVVADAGDWVAAKAEGVPPQSAPSDYVKEISRAMGGSPLETGFGFRVPTLAALRRREGR